MSSNIKIEAASGGSVTLKMDDALATNEDLIFDSISPGAGLDAGTISGLGKTSYIEKDVTLSTKVISMPNLPHFQGTLDGTAGTKADSYITFTTEFSQGITLTSTSTLTIVTPGLYFVAAYQMHNATGGISFQVMQNNNLQYRSHRSAFSYDDLAVQCILSCSVGDTIRFYINGTSSYSWGSVHSSISIFMLN